MLFIRCSSSCLFLNPFCVICLTVSCIHSLSCDHITCVACPFDCDTSVLNVDHLEKPHNQNKPVWNYTNSSWWAECLVDLLWMTSKGLKAKARPGTRQSSRGWLGRSSLAKTSWNSKTLRTERPTFRPTNTAKCRLACSRLKEKKLVL